MTPVRGRTSSIGGFDFPVRPGLDGRSEAVFWSPLSDPAIALICAAPAFLDLPSLEIGPLSAPRDAPEGAYAHFSGDPATQILLLPGHDPGGAAALLLPLDEAFPDRIEAALLLWLAIKDGPSKPDRRVTAYQLRRFRQMMRAADGRREGASYREIGIALYGRTRVETEPWKTSPLRDSVIGLVEGANRLIRGGYRKFLRLGRKR